jgi:hypothetical protein
VCCWHEQDRRGWEAEVREAAHREAQVLKARLASLVEKVERAEEEAQEKVSRKALVACQHPPAFVCE